MGQTLLRLLAYSSTVLLLLPAPCAHAQTVEAFYRQHNTIELIAGSGPASTYALWAKIVARTMQKHVPGHPIIIVKAMSGGGGIRAANYLYVVAPKDGTSIATFSRNLPLQAFLHANKGIKYDPRKFQWLGSVEATVRTCTVMAKSGVKTVEDLKHHEVTVGGTGAGSGQSFLPTVVNNLVGTKFKVVEGYKGVSEIHLAIKRGEVNGICGLQQTTKRDFAKEIKSGEMVILFNLERERDPDLHGVPSVVEFINDPEKKKLFNFLTSPTEMGRPFVAPPGVPRDRFIALKTAFEQTMQDEGFRSEVAKLDFRLHVTKGEKLSALVDELYATPTSIVDKALLLMPEGSLR